MPLAVGGSRRWLLVAAKLVILALLIWGVHRTLADGFRQLQEHPPSVSGGWLAAAGALYLVGIAPVCFFWWRVLRALGQPVSLPRCVRAYYIGHLGKYVPGKALVVVLRAGMIAGPGIDTAVAAASVFIETLTLMAAGSFIAAALILAIYHERWLYVVGAVVCMLAAGLPTLPPVFVRLLRMTKVGQAALTAKSRSPNGQDSATTTAASVDLAKLDYGTLLLGWIMCGVGWCITGLSLWATARAIGATSAGPLELWPQMTMITCVGVVAGFISMIPGGLGAREAVIVELATPILGVQSAIVTLLLRLVWLAAELVMAAVLWPMRFN